jgi:thiamine kinase-like enzyme
MNYKKIESQLKKIFENKNLKIIKIQPIKGRKLVSLKLENNNPERIVLKAYDNKEEFKRNFFALKELRRVINVPKFYGNIGERILIQEHFKAEPFYFLIKNKEISFSFLLKEIKKSAEILTLLHNFETKTLPKFLFNKFVSKTEKKNLSETLKNFIPPIKHLKKKWENNFRHFWEKEKELKRKNPLVLIHGDFHPANLMVKNDKELLLIDFDLMEIGNPAKDLGKFIAHLKASMEGKYPEKNIQIAINSFLNTYLQKRKAKFYPNFKENLYLYWAGMNFHIIKSKIFHLKLKGSNKKDIEKIENLLIEQEKLLFSKI